MGVIAESAPFVPNISRLSERIGRKIPLWLFGFLYQVL